MLWVVIIQEALRTRGLKDDTTCIVVDIIPPDNSEKPSPVKKQNILKSLLFRRKSSSNKLSKKFSAVGIVEELFEEGSAMLAERLVLGFVDYPFVSPAHSLLILTLFYDHYIRKGQKAGYP